MKLIKYFFYGLCGVLMVACVVTLIYAFNPSMTEDLSDKLYGNQTQEGDLEDYVVEYPVNQDAGLNADVLLLKGDGVYVVPSKQNISTPVSVIGMSGFESVRTDNVQVEESVGRPTTGESGSGLTFSTLIYPYYGMLDGTMKELYAQIYANALALNSNFSPIVSTDINQLKNVYEAVYNDHPELFWLDGSYTCKYLASGKCVEIQLSFNETAGYADTAREDFQAKADKFIKGAMALESNYAREKYVHDQLVNKVNYDTTAVMNQSAYSALVNGLSVCAGYSRAFQYIMQQLGIPCYYCTGYSGMDHAWNIVKQGDQYYNVDITWDDTNPSTVDYYNKSDIALSGSHMRTGLAVYLPACVNSMNLNPITGESLLDEDRHDEEELTDEEKKQQNLEDAGIKEEDVRATLQEYYDDCKKQMKEAGLGKHTFKNVIPESLWTRIEADYIDESYNEMYVREVLKELDAEHFAIQLQVQRLGGGYYRLYHNISIWNDPEPSTEESSSEEEESSSDSTDSTSTSSTDNTSADESSTSTTESSNESTSGSTDASGESSSQNTTDSSTKSK